MTHELQHKHRPALFKEVFGQEQATIVLQRFLKDDALPHTLLFVGPSGTGKTTLARILREKLDCQGNDFQEINAAESRGIDTVRDIKSRVPLSPAHGTCRIWLIDECQKLTSDSQSALLKILEDVPSHVYFFLCTTDPQKLLETLKGRCTKIQLNSLSEERIHELLTSIVTKEKAQVGIEVIEKIVHVSGGSAREAVVTLNKVIHLGNDEDRLKTIEDPKDKKQAWDLVKALLYEKPNWPKVAGLIKTLEIGNKESFRHLVLACAKTEMMKAGNNAMKAFFIMDVFMKPWYGFEEVALEYSCFEVLRQNS